MSLLFQGIGEPMYSVKFEDLLKAIGSNVAVLKIDIEGYECKVSPMLLWVNGFTVQ
jgi:hypothetical protein